MSVAFYIVPYTRITPSTPFLALRQCDLYIQFPEFEGQFEAEVRGNRALVKVNTDAATLAELDAQYYRLPTDNMLTRLSTVTVADRARIDLELINMGYTVLEISAAFPSGLAAARLGDILRFMASRVFAPRYDSLLNQIMLDQEERDNSIQVDMLDAKVR